MRMAKGNPLPKERLFETLKGDGKECKTDKKSDSSLPLQTKPKAVKILIKRIYEVLVIKRLLKQ